MTKATLPASDSGGWHRRVWVIAVPMMLANVTVPLLNAVDTGVMGHQGDAAYIGAVGLGSVIFSFVYWGFGFLRMGTGGFTAQAFGANDRQEMRACFLRAALTALVIAAAVFLLQWPILLLALAALEPSERVAELTTTYFQVRIWAAPATLLTYVVTGWLLGVQRARGVMVVQLLLNGLNITLSLVFVLVFQWGIFGVALATVVAEYAGVALGLWLVGRQARHLGGVWDLRGSLQRDKLLALFRVNRDIFIRTLCLELAFLLFARQSAQLGDNVLAANQILLRFLEFTAYGLDGFAYAAEALVGSAKGAGSPRDFNLAVRISTLWAGALAVLLCLLYWALGREAISLLTDLPDVRTLAGAFLVYAALLPIISVWAFQLDGIFIGTTRTAEMRNAMLISLAAYTPLAIWLTELWGNDGLWLALLTLMGVRALALLLHYPALRRSIG